MLATRTTTCTAGNMERRSAGTTAADRATTRASRARYGFESPGEGARACSEGQVLLFLGMNIVLFFQLSSFFLDLDLFIKQARQAGTDH